MHTANLLYIEPVSLPTKKVSCLPDIDWYETFNLLVKSATLRTILSLVVSRHSHVHQLDVKNAFVHGDLQRTVYMHPPPHYRDPLFPYYVC